MRQRNNLYWLIGAFIAVSLIVIFCIATTTIQACSDEMVEQQQIEAERIREKRETLVKETVSSAPVHMEVIVDAAVSDEAGYGGKGGLECEFKEDVERLACVIYQEAGGDACCDMCRKRVADVVLNRVKDSRFKGTTIEEILTDADPAPQWGLYSVTGIVWPEKASLPGEEHAVERAWETALEVLEGSHSDLTSDYIWCAEFPQGSNVIECCGIYFGT